jgi:dipeptidyl aminopeptidase/acylaminoacyl peptidase
MMRLIVSVLLVSVFCVGTALAQAAHPQFSPDGSRLAYFTYDLEAGAGTVMIMNMITRETEPVETGHVWSVNPSWAPDGQSLAVVGGVQGMGDDWDPFLIDLASGEIEQLIDTETREGHVHVSPDGSRLVFMRMGRGWDIHMMDLQSREVVQLTDTEAREFHPKWSGDGQHISFDRTQADGSTLIVRLNTRTLEETLVASAAEDARASLPAFIGNNPQDLTFGLNADTSRLMRASASGIVPIYEAPEGWSIGGASWRPGHNQVALSLGQGNAVSRIVLLDIESGETSLLAE